MKSRKASPSDVTDAEWEILKPLIPAISAEAVIVVHERREIVNGILYVLRSGCPWRLLPNDLPAWGTVYSYFWRWRNEGIWDQVLATLRQRMRQKQGRAASPSAAVIDSQSIKTSAVRGPEKGIDMEKKSGDAKDTPWSIPKAISCKSKSRLPVSPTWPEPGRCSRHSRLSFLV